MESNKKSSYSFDTTNYLDAVAIEPDLSKYTSLLDGEGYISLGNILATYDAPINEEHAWALCYLSAKYLETHLLSFSTSRHDHISLFKKPTLNHADLLKIHYQHGHLALDLNAICEHDASRGFPNGNVEDEESIKLELVSKIAIIIYKALDFGLKEEEERSLNIELENLLGRMASCLDASVNFLAKEKDTKCFGEQDIIKACLLHFQHTGRAHTDCVESFYRQVCKNLVLNTLEFSRFLCIAERASSRLKYFCCCTKSTTQNLTEKSTETFMNDLKEVAKIWINVVRELRHGVKLKRLDESVRHSREYKKNPYEQLMEDIRTQKYQLRKVPQFTPEGPRETLDLHDVIMEYIRSRPKLRKASERVLKPRSGENDPYEELMNSIRQVHHLRPVADQKS